MGRISKRKAVEEPVQPVNSKRTYKAGIYARLSSDLNTEKNESLEIQMEITKKYVEEFNQKKHGEMIEIVECYTDLGKTGSNFERDGFLRLMQDIRLGEIDCIIVKDLSRFGRNYLEVGNYIEKIFPFLGVRFIAVADGYDTKEDGNNKQMASEIKNLINDMYAKDFSRKAKLHLKQRREEGSYVGGPPPYGYKAEWDGKKRVLVPDENTSPIVQLIYEKFVELENITAVVDELNHRKINPPVMYKNTKSVHYTAEDLGYKGWTRGSVERILESKTYMGMLVQGKTSMTARDEKNRVHKGEGEWIVLKNAHEPLIDARLYQQAQLTREKIQARTTVKCHTTKDCIIGENIFDNVLYCGICGNKMIRRSFVKHNAENEMARIESYFCPNGGGTKVTICPKPNYISKQKLTEILIPLVHTEFAVYLNTPAFFIEYGKARIAKAKKKLGVKVRGIENKIMRLRAEEDRIYIDYRGGKLSQQGYTVCKVKQARSLADLEKQKDFLDRQIKEMEKCSDKYLATIKKLMCFRSARLLTREMITFFFSKIYIYPEKRVEAIFTFTASCMERVRLK